MKVLLFGHSYVNNLRNLGGWDRSLHLSGGQKIDLEFAFHSRPGKDYDFFYNNPEEFDRISEVNPDILVCILGGNLIVESVTDHQLRQEVLKFYKSIRDTVGLGCKVLSAQVEPRYAAKGNRFGTPQIESYNRKRQLINNFVNKSVRQTRHLVDHNVMLVSVNKFTVDKFRQDGVHLNQEGLQMYRHSLINTIKYSLEKSQ